jgi:hypothetical protein
VETGSTLVRVVPGRTGRWEVREPGSSRALFETDSPVVAVARARRLLTGGGIVEVLDQTGRVLETQAVPPPAALPRRWYIRPGTQRRVLLVLSLYWVLSSPVRLRPGADTFDVAFGLLGAAVGLALMLGIFLSVRFDRSADWKSSDHDDPPHASLP